MKWTLVLCAVLLAAGGAWLAYARPWRNGTNDSKGSAESSTSNDSSSTSGSTGGESSTSGSAGSGESSPNGSAGSAESSTSGTEDPLAAGPPAPA